MLYKEIHLGELIKERVAEQEISIERICNFLDKEESVVEELYANKSMDTELLLRWCKLLEYDFFRIYSSHLILYAPPSAVNKNHNKSEKIPYFRKKHIYSGN